MSNYNLDIRRAIPAEFANGGYGPYEATQSISNMAAQAIDQNLLQHENPNRCTDQDLAPALPIEQYRLNVDQNPHVVRRKPNEKVSYLQEIAVRYLKPPPPPRAGDIVIKELPAKQVAPAPPLIVRQPGPKAPTPPPVCIREAPPQPPQPLPGKTITVPGKTIPPPARKVIVERLPPVPPKPQQIFVERWLPYGEQRQRVVFEAAKAICHVPDPKNVVIQWDAPDVEVRREVKNLGVQQADPQDYLRRHGAQLVRPDQLPEVAVKYAQTQGVQLAASTSASQNVVIEGDVQALSLIDLDANGLGYLRERLASQSASNLGSSGASFSQHQSQPAQSLYESYGNDSGLSHSYGNVNLNASNAHLNLNASNAHLSNLNASNGHLNLNASNGHLNLSGSNGGHALTGLSASAGSQHNLHASYSSEQSGYNASYAQSIPGAYPCDGFSDVPQQQQQQQVNDFPC